MKRSSQWALWGRGMPSSIMNYFNIIVYGMSQCADTSGDTCRVFRSSGIRVRWDAERCWRRPGERLESPALLIDAAARGLHVLDRGRARAHATSPGARARGLARSME